MTCMRLVVRATLLGILSWGSLAHVTYAISQSNSELTGGVTPLVSWPMFHNQQSHLGFNPFEKTISKSNAQRLGIAWQGLMGDIADNSSPAIANGIAYIGSFDGRLYAFNADGCGQDTCQP